MEKGVTEKKGKYEKNIKRRENPREARGKVRKKG